MSNSLFVYCTKIQIILSVLLQCLVGMKKKIIRFFWPSIWSSWKVRISKIQRSQQIELKFTPKPRVEARRSFFSPSVNWRSKPVNHYNLARCCEFGVGFFSSIGKLEWVRESIREVASQKNTFVFKSLAVKLCVWSKIFPGLRPAALRG